ncbi:hypothetical protein F5888DRAFT_1635427 [Russula emetica]|nr:hypothetical protein F5888DRAFT_1635427 [Russula emetica]
MTGKLPGVILYHRIPKIAQALIRRSSVSLWHFHPVQTTLLLNSKTVKSTLLILWSSMKTRDVARADTTYVEHQIYVARCSGDTRRSAIRTLGARPERHRKTLFPKLTKAPTVIMIVLVLGQGHGSQHKLFKICSYANGIFMTPIVWDDSWDGEDREAEDRWFEDDE